MRTDPAETGRTPGADAAGDSERQGERGERGERLSLWRRWRAWLPFVARPLRHGIVIFIVLLIVEYLVVPELVGASKDLYLLGRVNAFWLAAGVILESWSLFCYGLLTQTMLPPGAHNPGLSRLFRIDLAAAAVAHVIPAGTLGSAAVGYKLFTAEGIKGHDATVMMAAKGLGSTVVLNVLLWLSLVVSIPLAGFHPIYVTVAITGAVIMLAVAALAFGFIRGARRASRILHFVGDRIPGMSGDRLERALLDAASSLSALARRPGLAAIAGALSLNDGGLGLDPRRWSTTWFKGGSEPGVLTLTYEARTRTGRTYFVAVLADNRSKAIDGSVADPRLLAAIKGAFALAAKSGA